MPRTKSRSLQMSVGDILNYQRSLWMVRKVDSHSVLLVSVRETGDDEFSADDNNKKTVARIHIDNLATIHYSHDG